MRQRKKAAQTAAFDEVAKLRGSEGDESSHLTGFGETAGAFFEHAWEERDGDGESDERYRQFGADEASESASELRLDRFADRADKKVRGSRVALLVVVFVAISVGGWFLLSERAADVVGPVLPEPSFDDGLAAIGAERTYVTSARNDFDNGAVLDERFQASADGELVRLGPASGDIRFAVLQWGGRMNVAVVGSGVGDPDSCVVATLTDGELRSVDVAAIGSTCDTSFASTGDRTSCNDPGLVILELWPTPKSLDSPAGAPVKLRVRIVDRNGVSDRGQLDLAELGALPVLSGKPGETARVGMSGLSGMCKLIDRAGVRVQLL